MKRSILMFFTFLPSFFLHAEYCKWEGPQTQNCSAQSTYQATNNFNANNCEFYVEGFGEGNWSHNGNTANWIEAYLKVDAASLEVAQRGKVLSAGLYTEGNYFLGIKNADGKYRVGMTHHLTPNGESARPLGDFALFIDVKRQSGIIDRLWLTNAGVNFNVTSVFAGAQSTEQTLGSGTVRWAGESSVIFNQSKACSK